MNTSLQQRNLTHLLTLLALLGVTGLVGCGKSPASETAKATTTRQSGEQLDERDAGTVHTAETDTAEKKTGQ